LDIKTDRNWWRGEGGGVIRPTEKKVGNFLVPHRVRVREGDGQVVSGQVRLG